MRRTESAYTPDRRMTERTPPVADGAPEGGDAVTCRTVPRDVSVVKYRHLTAITI
jgi:hypothetical protein